MYAKNILFCYCALLMLGLQVSISESTCGGCSNDSGCCGENVACRPGATNQEITCACKKGYINVAKNGKLECQDVCRVNNGGCDSNAICSICPRTDKVVCTCKNGFTGVEAGGQVKCRDSCTIANGGCDKNAACSHDKTTNDVVCTCKPGFINVRKNGKVVCADICSVNNGGCGKNADCSHKPNSNIVLCKCRPGYTNINSGSTSACIDSCMVRNGGCSSNAVCSHDPKTREPVCRCKPGYVNVGTDKNVQCKLKPVQTTRRKPCRPIVFDDDKDHVIKHTDDDDDDNRIDGVINVKLCRPTLFIRKPYRHTSIFGKLHELFHAHLLKGGINEVYPIHIGKIDGQGDQSRFHYSVSCNGCDKRRKEIVEMSLRNACKDKSFADTLTMEKQPDSSESSSESKHS